jgi:hypothetical protein
MHPFFVTDVMFMLSREKIGLRARAIDQDVGIKESRYKLEIYFSRFPFTYLSCLHTGFCIALLVGLFHARNSLLSKS